MRRLAPFLLLASVSALADGVLYEGPEAVESVRLGPSPRVEVCENGDPDCATRILRVLSGFNYARLRLLGGPLLSPSGRDTAGGLQLTIIDAHMPLGDLSLGKFDFIGLSRSDPFRARFTLAESEVSFFCHDSEGRLHPPAIGRIQQYCTPNASYGAGFKLLELQTDPAAKRFAARWAEFTGSYNLLGNGQGLDYVRRHLNLIAGASLETVSTSVAVPDAEGARTRIRGLAGLSGLWRSADSHWEANGTLALRPGLIGQGGFLGDTAAEARVTLLRHLLLSRSILLSAGLTGEVSYWKTPEDSIGTFASDRQRNTYFIGLVLGGSFEFTDL